MPKNPEVAAPADGASGTGSRNQEASSFPGPRSLLWIAVAVALSLSLVPLGYFIKSTLLEIMVKRGTHALLTLGESLPKSVPQADESEDFSPLFFEPTTLPQAKAAPVNAPTFAKKKHSGTTPVTLVPQKEQPQNSRASKSAVLYWAENNIVPLSRSRPAEGGLPAGLELSQVQGLGLALLEGDRLTHVGETPVKSRAEVVAAVLGARARAEEVILARLVRLTRDGPKTFVISIEQPYVEQPVTDAKR